MKALRLSHAALETTSPGKVINLMSNDVNRFDAMSILLNSLWTAPLLVIIVGYLLWVEVRWAGMFGLVIVFIVVPIQSKTLSFYSNDTFKKQFSILLDRLYWQVVVEIPP